MNNRIADGRTRPPRKARQPGVDAGCNGHTNGKAGVNGHAAEPLGPVGDGVGKPAAPPPLTPPPAGKDPATGRFTAGNRYGRGNPHARRQAEMHAAFMDAITPSDVKALAVALFAKAAAGDVAAAQLVLSYVVGRPLAAHDPDRLDLEEWLLTVRSPSTAEVLHGCVDTLTPDAAAAYARGFREIGGKGGDGRFLAVYEALPPHLQDAMQEVARRVAAAVDYLNDEPGCALDLQLGELRKTRSRRGGAR